MIIIDHLVKTFGTNYAVDDVSFEIKKGEVVGFLGLTVPGSLPS